MPDGQIGFAPSSLIEQTVASIKRFSTKDGEAWRTPHDRFHQLIRDYLIPYYYESPQTGAAILQKLDSEPEGKDLDGCGR